MNQQETLSSPSKTTAARAIKFTMEHYRKEGVSEEAFMDWFTNVVMPKAVPVLKKHGVLKFAVVSCEMTLLTGKSTKTMQLAQDRAPN